MVATDTYTENGGAKTIHRDDLKLGHRAARATKELPCADFFLLSPRC